MPLRATLDVLLEHRKGRLNHQFRVRAEDGHYHWLSIRARPVLGANGEIIRCVGTIIDITEQRNSVDRLLQDALHDNLTGLPNRASFLERLNRQTTTLKSGETLYAVGDWGQDGKTWSRASGVKLSAKSDGTYAGTVSVKTGHAMAFRLIKVDANGKTTWDSAKDRKSKADKTKALGVSWTSGKVNEDGTIPDDSAISISGKGVADGKLSCQLYQRSADIFLGVPFNIASYALLLQMMAQVTGLQPGEFVHTTGDTHLYLNHLEQARLQLSRTPRPLPTMRINPDVKSIFDFRYEDFELENYDPWPHIAA